jgi:uracil-DNA glycosylase
MEIQELETYMREALKLSEEAYSQGEVPVGAIVVHRPSGEIVGRGYNRREYGKNSLAHAEMLAINEASETLKGWRLVGCDLYVTLEPCPMCTGAIINSRVENLYFGAYDDKAGSVCSKVDLFSLGYNHKPDNVVGGILQDECSAILSKFFKKVRSINKFFGGKDSMVHFENDWEVILKDEFQKEYYQKLRAFLINEYKTQTIYPNMYNIFNALKYTSYEDVKVVIIGQDPYHQPNQAHGLAFSVLKGNRVPPSLVNIFKEIQTDVGINNLGKHGELTKWAREGVLLLNNVLTVRDSSPNSHKGRGWENFTDDVIQILNHREKPMVFILWGANARAKARLVTNPNHLVLQSAHPSPLSAYNGFFGSRPFSQTNNFLIANGMQPIDWSID